MKTLSYRCRLFWLSLLMVPALAAPPALAASYNFEIILFERPGGGTNEFWAADPGEPDPAKAVGRISAAGGSSGATLLPASAKSLGPAAYTLKKKGMVIHSHLAWRQVTRGRNSNSWYWIGGGRLSGLIRLSRGRFLHLDTDLVLRDANTARPYRIKLHRRMRSNELHYVDHPKLGILIRAKRSRAAAPPSGPDGPSSGEPKPAAPLPTAQPG